MEVLALERLVGRMVISKAGRDRGRPFVIVKVVNERFVLVADGDLRKVSNPKIKNIKHLMLTNRVVPEVVQSLEKGEVLDDNRLRKWVRSMWLDYKKEEREGGSPA